MLALTMSEALAGVLGFLATLHVARRVGPGPFASLEFAWAAVAWLLVLVRGGIDLIVYREAARRPRLIRAFTGHLLGLRLAASALSYAMILGLACTAHDSSSRLLLVVSALILWPSALATDVGMRARAQLRTPALAQGARALFLVVATWCAVSSPGDLPLAALAVVMAEGVSVLILNVAHAREFGPTLPRFRRRLWLALLRRGLIATLIRFLRVGLYAADILALGWLAADDLGSYAGGRRIVFALLAVLLVIPASIAPPMARAWASGAPQARRVYASARSRLLALALPSACGLALTSGPVLSTLFGPGYRGAASALALLALRLPWLLLSSLDLSALVACRRERQALGLLAALWLATAALVPASGWLGGAPGVAGSLLFVEVLGAVLGWSSLRSLGVACRPFAGLRAPALGCAALSVACLASASCPLPLTCALGALTYALVWTSQDGPRVFITEESPECPTEEP